MLLAFVAGAALFPGIVVPLGVFLAMTSALGVGRSWLPRALSILRSSLRRRTYPTLAILALLLLLLLVATLPAFAFSAVVHGSGAGIAQLRAYPFGSSGDPSADSSYVTESPDPWLVDSWLITVASNTATFGLNVSNYWSIQAYSVRLRVAVNDVALLTSISLTVVDGDVPGMGATLVLADFVNGIPVLSDGTPWPSHGVYPTWWSSFPFGGIGPLDSANDTVVLSITASGDFVGGLKIHFDADGWTYLPGPAPILTEDTKDSNVRNPNSMDTTVQIPTVTSVAVPAASLGLLYTLIRRRRRSK